MLQWVNSVLNFLMWYILRWVSNVLIFLNVTGFCLDYSSVAHAGHQVHCDLYQKGVFAMWVTQPVQNSYPKRVNARLRLWNTNPVDFIYEMINTFIILMNWNSFDLFGRVPKQNVVCQAMSDGKLKKVYETECCCGKSILMDSFQ